MKILSESLANFSHFGRRRELAGSERLRVANGARVTAQAALDEVRATFQRLADIRNVADDAANAAAKATHAASEARQKWAREGCRYSGYRTLQQLDEAAGTAAVVAQRASSDSAAVLKEIPAAELAVRSAESELSASENGITSAIYADLLEEFWPVIERRAQLIEELQSCEIKIRGLRDFISGEAERRLTLALAGAQLKAIPDFQVTNAGTVVSRPPAEVLALTESWRARAAAMRSAAES